MLGITKYLGVCRSVDGAAKSARWYQLPDRSVPQVNGADLSRLTPEYLREARVGVHAAAAAIAHRSSGRLLF